MRCILPVTGITIFVALTIQYGIGFTIVEALTIQYGIGFQVTIVLHIDDLTIDRSHDNKSISTHFQLRRNIFWRSENVFCHVLCQNDCYKLHWFLTISFMYVKIKWYHGHLPSSINSSTLEKWVRYLKSMQSLMLTRKKWYCSTLMTISLRIFWFIIGLNFFFLQSHVENPHFYKIKITFCFNNHHLNLIQTSII